MPTQYDFSGYATRNDIRCSDGRTIRRNAFIGNDGQTVPIVWQHRHDAPSNVLGHALLENCDDGVKCYGVFNDTSEGQRAKTLVRHGDIKHLSIYANQLRQTNNGDVMHGNIREVSLVLAGANPGAYIETLDIQHSVDLGYEEEFDAVMFTNDRIELSDDLAHADDKLKKKPLIEEETVEETVEVKPQPKDTKTNDSKEEKNMPDKNSSEKTVKDVFDELTEEQKNVVYFMIGEAIKSAQESNDDKEAKHSYYDEEDYLMHTNVFENSARDEFLQHAEEFFGATEEIFKDAKRLGSLKESVIQHADDYGIKDIDYLFPDAKTLENAPDFINQDQEFVKVFMDKVHKSPFSRIKSIHADITETEARAKGYTKGKKKIDEVFKLLKRTTNPTTVYKKQKLDRDSVIDITDFDVIAWMKQEMRVKLDQEIVRAALIGDGRNSGEDDKISEDCIRPIWTDATLYTVNAVVTVPSDADADVKAKEVIKGIIRARKDYRGSGNPIFFTTEDALTEMLLLEDGMGRDLYETVDKLATKLRVSQIVTVEDMAGKTRTTTSSSDPEQQKYDNKTRELYGIIVNPADYNFGSDKGGQVSMFDDFDLDFNAMKYLIETRLSGALTKPFSAIAVEVITED